MKYREFTKKEEAWIKDFQKLMIKAPDTLLMFVGSGTLLLYPLDQNGNRYMEGYSVDGYCTNHQIKTKLECDGGDW